MAKRPTLTDLTSLTNSSAINALNENWDAIQEAFDNTLSLDGSTPNAMEADLDLNGNALLNVGTIDVSNLTLDGQTITDIATVPEWRSSWVTATSYAKNDLVKAGGNVYICLEAHTSGTFATDLTALKWELMVSKGDSGAGTGDLVSTNNLSDLDNIPTARANLGLGTVVVESTVPISKGGTGATDAATARINLGAQAQDTFLDQIAGLTDPNADRVLFWDESANAFKFLQLGSGLSITDTTISASVTSVLAFGWHPYNMAEIGDGSTGLIYDFAVSGAVGYVTAPTLEDGYDYIIHWSGISSNVGSALRFNSVNCTVAGASGDAHTGYLEILMPTKTNWPKTAFVNTRITGGSTGVATLNSAAATPFVGHFNFSAMATALTSIDLSWSAGSFDAGKVFLYRRRNLMT